MKKVLITFIALMSLTFVGTTQLVGAQTAKDAVCEGLGAVSGTSGCEQAAGEETVDNTIATVINILSIIGAVIAIIMIMIGGFRFITSSGDSGSTASARNTVIYAVVGLVIIALAQLIVLFVVERAAPTAAPPPPAGASKVRSITL